MGNEGKMIVIISAKNAEKALEALKNTKHGADSRIVGNVTAQSPQAHGVTMKTRIGGARRIPVLQGEGLPRIC
jgi:hydrogenase expression/formation protein HypE